MSSITYESDTQGWGLRSVVDWRSVTPHIPSNESNTTCTNCLNGSHRQGCLSGEYCQCSVCHKTQRDRRSTISPSARRAQWAKDDKAAGREVDLEKIRQLRQAGFTWRDIGSALGADFGGVRRKAFAAGIR